LKIKNEIIRNKTVINCYNTPENIAKNIIKRTNTKSITTPQHRNKSFEEIAKAQIEALDKVKLFANILEENRVKVLNIHTSEQKDGNVEKNKSLY